MIKKFKDICFNRKNYFVISDDIIYKRCKVKLHYKGVLLRDEVIGAEIKTKKQRLCKKDDFIVAEMDAKFGGYGIIPASLEGAIVSSHYYLYELDKKQILPEFLEIFIKTGLIQEQIKAVGSTNYSRISAKEVLEYEIYCPSIKRQKEIIKFFKNAIKVINPLTKEISHQKNLLTQLKKSILQEAIEGKLTADWRKENPTVESAEVLLQRIKAEKQQLIAEKKIKKEKPLPKIGKEEIPFDLPEGWVWCRLQETGLFRRGKSKHRPRNAPFLYENGSIPFVQTGEIARSKYTNYKIKSCKAYYNENGLAQSKLWKKGTMCITIAANIAQTGFLTFDACFPDSVVGFTVLSDDCIAKYIRCFIDLTKSNIEKYAPATAQKNINLGIIHELILPLPPEKEQAIIVKKVENLQEKINALQTQIHQSESHARMLLQAVLKEAFASEDAGVAEGN